MDGADMQVEEVSSNLNLISAILSYGSVKQ